MSFDGKAPGPASSRHRGAGRCRSAARKTRVAAGSSAKSFSSIFPFLRAARSGSRRCRSRRPQASGTLRAEGCLPRSVYAHRATLLLTVYRVPTPGLDARPVRAVSYRVKFFIPSRRGGLPLELRGRGWWGRGARRAQGSAEALDRGQKAVPGRLRRRIGAWTWGSSRVTASGEDAEDLRRVGEGATSCRPVRRLRCTAPRSPLARTTVADAVRTLSQRLMMRADAGPLAAASRASLGQMTTYLDHLSGIFPFVPELAGSLDASLRAVECERPPRRRERPVAATSR